MLDGQIVAALIAEIRNQLEIYGLAQSETRVARSQQPTSQNAGSHRFEAYITPVTNTDVGWSRKYDYGASNLAINHVKQKTYQIAALTQFDPTNPGDMPAQDLAHVIHDMIQQPDAIRALKAKGVDIQQCTPVRPSFNINEADEFESMPSFDIVLSYNTEYTKPVPAITDVTGIVGRV